MTNVPRIVSQVSYDIAGHTNTKTNQAKLCNAVAGLSNSAKIAQQIKTGKKWIYATSCNIYSHFTLEIPISKVIKITIKQKLIVV